MHKSAPLIFILLLAFSAPALAVVEEGAIKIYAVTSDGEGLVASLHLQIEPGTGRVWSAVTPLVGTSTQNAERTAVSLARRFYPNVSSYDFKYSIDSPASVVDGPSAGAAMALLTISMLLDRPVPDYVSLTGTISESGRVGPVGGIFEKASEASKTGTELFLIPRGEAVQTVRLPGGVRSVNLIEYGPDELGMKIAEVSDIEDALALAAADLEDVNPEASQGQDSVPDFVPQKVEISERLLPFKALTTNYTRQTRQAAAEARNALSSSLLEDAGITQSLLEVLNNAEGTVSSAEILNEQNYLYSAANLAFLAKVDATIVKEISNNPKLLEEDSSDLDIKLLALKSELDRYGSSLGGNPPREGIEWLASAQQRYTYAKLTVQRLMTQQTIVVGGTADERLQIAFERVQDYAFAVEWLGVSKEFHQLSKAYGESTVKRPADFANSMDALISQAEADLNAALGDGSREDIQRRIDSAKDEKESGWFEASYFDAASAKALIAAENESIGKDAEGLRAMLTGKITAVERMVSDSGTDTGWAVLYLDHAKYYLSASDFYAEQGAPGAAANNLQSGYALALLAENIFTAAHAVNTVYAGLPEAVSNGAGGGTARGLDNFTIIAVVLLLAALVLSLTILFAGLMRRNRKFSLLKEIEKEKAKLKDAEDRFSRGKIDSEAHERLKGEHSSELGFLEAERRKKALHILAMDNYSSEVAAYNAKLRGARKHLKEGIISAEEFGEKSAEFGAKIDELKKSLHDEIDQISRLDEEARQGQKASGTERPEAGSMLPVPEGTEALVPFERPAPKTAGKKAAAAAPKPRKRRKPAGKGGGAGIRHVADYLVKKGRKKK